MTDPTPSSVPDWQRHLQGAMGETVHLEVSPDNVLDIRKAVLTAAQRMLKYQSGSDMQADWVGECAQDPVSKLAAAAFNKRIAIMTQRCADFGTQLQNAGNSLEHIAKDYGYTEEQIQASFKTIHPDAQA